MRFIQQPSTTPTNQYHPNFDIDESHHWGRVISFIPSLRLLILACSLFLCSFTLQSQVANPIPGIHGDTSGAINPTPKQNVRQQAVMKAIAAAAEARQMMEIIEKMRDTKDKIASHPIDSTETKKLVKANEPKNEKLAD